MTEAARSRDALPAPSGGLHQELTRARVASAVRARRREATTALAVATSLLVLLWALDAWILQIPVLTPLGQQPALSPIYAFWQPAVRATALLFPVLCLVLLHRLPALLRVESTSRGAFTIWLLLASLLLPLSLFLVREPWSQLGALLAFYPGEEIYYDALGIRDLGAFYRGYVERVALLSLHGQHFPPGFATLHYTILQLLGTSLRSAAIVFAAIFAAGMLCARRALCLHLGEERGRQAVLLCLASPSLLDFAFTSTDAVFFAAACFALWLSLLALGSTRRYGVALLAGAALLLATLLSYSALPLGLAIGLVGLFRCFREGRAPLLTLGLMGASWAGLLAALQLGTGFNLPLHFASAYEHNAQLMTRVIGASPAEHYALIAYGNAAGFLIGLGVAVTSALLLRSRSGGFGFEPLRAAIACSFALLILGNLHQMETERIWLYTVPWLAALALEREPLPAQTLAWLLVAGWAQAWAMEALLFTIW